jgi:hypothetical protein
LLKYTERMVLFNLFLFFVTVGKMVRSIALELHGVQEVLLQKIIFIYHFHVNV